MAVKVCEARELTRHEAHLLAAIRREHGVVFAERRAISRATLTRRAEREWARRAETAWRRVDRARAARDAAYAATVDQFGRDQAAYNAAWSRYAEADRAYRAAVIEALET